MKLLSFYNTPYRKTACGPNAKAHVLQQPFVHHNLHLVSIKLPFVRDYLSSSGTKV